MRSPLVYCVVVLTSTCLSAQASSSVHPWARFAPGARMTMKVTEGGEISKISERLEAVGARSCTVVRESGGAEQRIERDLFAEGEGHLHPDSRVVGKRSFSVGERTFECSIVKYQRELAGSSLEESALMAPGIVAPLMITSKSSSKTWFVLNAVALEEMVKVGETTIPCVRYVGTRSRDGVRSKVVEWHSASVPGGLVKAIETRKSGEQEVRVERVVVGFHGDPAADASQLGG